MTRMDLEVSRSSHRPGVPFLGPYVEDTSPLDWWEDCRSDKGWGGTDAACEECACADWILRQGRGGRPEWLPGCQ